MTELAGKVARLEGILRQCDPMVVAVSGGVDSMTLAHAAHGLDGLVVAMYHAVSPAVPAQATSRVRRHAAERGWNLRILDAGEFRDENYLSNPANRCFFCKSNLYGSLASTTSDQLLSGANLDDLSDWRPGLEAARDHRVRHPFVEAEMTKADVRALARSLALEDLAELPASPCLSSRIETGIRIDAEDLKFIDRTEDWLKQRLMPKTVRCRMRREGVMIELDEATLAALDREARRALMSEIKQFAPARGMMGVIFSPYRRGSAFLRETLT